MYEELIGRGKPTEPWAFVVSILSYGQNAFNHFSCSQREYGPYESRGWNELLHFLTTSFVGTQFAIEVSQMFYRKVRLIVESASDVRNTLKVDPLTPHPSRRPLDCIR